MWDIIIALVFVYPAVEIAEEWRRRRVTRRLLLEMRKHVEQHHPVGRRTRPMGSVSHPV